MEETPLPPPSLPGREEAASRPTLVAFPPIVPAALPLVGDVWAPAAARRPCAASLTGLRGAERPTVRGLPREGAFCSRFFESDHDTHSVTLMTALVAPAS